MGRKYIAVLGEREDSAGGNGAAIMGNRRMAIM
jgi:hypothetical protein